jgi:hypothetical protein
MLRVLEPALRMKAQADSNSRGRKDFICREFSWRKEKRKTAYWRMQGDPETGDPLGLGGEWGFIAYLHCLRMEMPFKCKQAFLREEKCLLDHLLPFWDFPQSVLQSFNPENTKAFQAFKLSLQTASALSLPTQDHFQVYV